MTFAKTGPGSKRNERLPASSSVMTFVVRAHDVGGHQVRSELDSRERQVEGGAESPDQEGLPQAGDPLEEAVAVGEEGGEHALDDLAVADDDLADRLTDRLDLLGEGRGPGFQFLGHVRFPATF